MLGSAFDRYEPRCTKMAAQTLFETASLKKRFTVVENLWLLREIAGCNPFTAPERWGQVLPCLSQRARFFYARWRRRRWEDDTPGDGGALIWAPGPRFLGGGSFYFGWATSLKPDALTPVDPSEQQRHHVPGAPSCTDRTACQIPMARCSPAQPASTKSGLLRIGLPSSPIATTHVVVILHVHTHHIIMFRRRGTAGLHGTGCCLSAVPLLSRAKK